MSNVFIETKRGSAYRYDDIVEFSIKGNETIGFCLYAIASKIDIKGYPKNELQIHICDGFKTFEDCILARDLLFDEIMIALLDKTQILIKTSNFISKIHN